MNADPLSPFLRRRAHDAPSHLGGALFAASRARSGACCALAGNVRVCTSSTSYTLSDHARDVVYVRATWPLFARAHAIRRVLACADLLATGVGPYHKLGTDSGGWADVATSPRLSARLVAGHGSRRPHRGRGVRVVTAGGRSPAFWALAPVVRPSPWHRYGGVHYAAIRSRDRWAWSWPPRHRGSCGIAASLARRGAAKRNRLRFTGGRGHRRAPLLRTRASEARVRTIKEVRRVDGRPARECPSLGDTHFHRSLWSQQALDLTFQSARDHRRDPLLYARVLVPSAITDHSGVSRAAPVFTSAKRARPLDRSATVGDDAVSSFTWRRVPGAQQPELI